MQSAGFHQAKVNIQSLGPMSVACKIKARKCKCANPVSSLGGNESFISNVYRLRLHLYILAVSLAFFFGSRISGHGSGGGWQNTMPCSGSAGSWWNFGMSHWTGQTRQTERSRTTSTQAQPMNRVQRKKMIQEFQWPLGRSTSFQNVNPSKMVKETSTKDMQWPFYKRSTALQFAAKGCNARSCPFGALVSWWDSQRIQPSLWHIIIRLLETAAISVPPGAIQKTWL